MRTPKFAQFYCCYVLESIPRPRSHYIGSTPLPLRRLRQHNGELQNGAYKTRPDSKRPWNMVCIVSGFPSKINALQFEHAWQHPQRTRHIKPQDRISKSQRTIRQILGNLRLLLTSESLRRLPLKVHIFDNATSQEWDRNFYKLADPEVPVVIDIRQQDNEKNPPSKVHVHEGDGKGGIKGLKIGNDIYQPYFDKALSKATRNSACKICHESTSESEMLVCSNIDCLEVYHNSCLATEFLKQENQQREESFSHVLPVKGTCISCRHDVEWALMVRNLSWRLTRNMSCEENDADDEIKSSPPSSQTTTPVTAKPKSKRTKRRSPILQLEISDSEEG
ncbi:uncharacterized protein V1516DRAFT_676213 [Lipomyces oligophaga]|uniref:uncharacterized protein n=1 Tax=Lipomyces oligophaga TaxID=45792 RepID=UPI0034CD54D6